MKKLTSITLVFLAGAWFSACAGSSTTTSCTDNNDCVAGYLCDQGKCNQHDPVRITTESLPNATIDAEYDFTTEASDGVGSYEWSLGEHPSWLGINAGTGALSGTPTEAASGLTVKIHVKDASEGRDSSADKSFTLDVSVCVEGDTSICHEVQDDKCMEGRKNCTGGQWSSCMNLEYSTDRDYCGPGCDVCDGDVADDCLHGACSCGDYAACEGADICCDSDCLNGSSDAENCGACGLKCADGMQNASNPHCTDGVCTHDACTAGFLDCDADTANGCETVQSTQICGACDTDCTQQMLHVGASECVDGDGGGQCDYTGDGTQGEGCDFGFLDCDGDRGNGCETAISEESEDNCGSCGNACAAKCQVAPEGDHYYCACTQNSECGSGGQCCDGACVDLFDPSRCGSCDNDCAPQLANTTDVLCNQGTCDYTSCAQGYLDCDSDRSNGCETSFSNDDCGLCGFSCGANAFCDVGNCACDADFGNCLDGFADGCETDLRVSKNHCGACDINCDDLVDHVRDNLCVDSLCDFTNCLPGFLSCDDDRTNGCEENIWVVDACGSGCQGRVDCSIQVQNSDDQICTSGNCDFGSCQHGYGDCDQDRTNGCEYDIYQTTSCGPNCNQLVDCTVQTQHASQIFCSDGSCDYSLCGIATPFSTWADCDGDRTNGCEEQIRATDNCGTTCDNTIDCNVQVLNADGTLCFGGSCDYDLCLSTSGHDNTDCDGDRTNGCETDLKIDFYNCGSCGHPCTVMQTCVNGVCS
ncbi:MAG TPA: Ig domain-containing protein [Myxococcota bacterium]|nr:Ig domain-containing protein [Myxococcota bacterium]